MLIIYIFLAKTLDLNVDSPNNM